MPVIGFLNSQSATTFAHLTEAFFEGLLQRGYVPDENVAVDYRWADGRYDRLPELAAELVNQKVNVLFAGGGQPPAFAAQAATATIPVVIVAEGADAVARGFVASLNRPGGNVTGVGLFAGALDRKRLEMVHQLLPDVGTVAALLNPALPDIAEQRARLAEAAARLGLNLTVVTASTEAEIDAAFATMARDGVRALLIGTDPYFYSRRSQVVALAGRFGIPAAYTQRDYATAGGLMSYGSDLRAAYRQAGNYVARILDGENPAEMPIVQDAVFEFVINLRTARDLGLAVPQDLMIAATEVIE